MASGMRLRADDSCTVEEQQLYNNLCLLGMAGSGSSSKGLAAGVELNKYTFRKPSTKVLEAVLYQLYALVCGDAAAQKEFKNVFPVADSSQAKEFSQRISDWLKLLKDGGYLEMNSISTASQLRTASGFRLVTTLLDLSTYALSALFQRLHPQAAASYTFKLQTTKDLKQQQLLNELVHAAKAVALMDVRTQAREYARISREAAAVQRREEAAAEQLRELYYSLKARHMQLCSQLDPAHAELLKEMATLEEPRANGPSAAETTAANDQALLRSLSAAPVGPATLAPLSLSRPKPEPGAALAPEPAPQQVSELLGSLRDQLAQVYAPLQQVLEEVSASAPAAAAATAAGAGGPRAGMMHPNAIDGAALMAAAGARGAQLPAAGEAVDIVGLLHKWTRGLEACVAPMYSLGGQPPPPGRHATAAGGHGWNPTSGLLPGPGGGAAAAAGGEVRGGVHPLLAPPHVSSSHAALLATQLGLHRGSLAALHGMSRALAEQLGAAGLRSAELEAAVWARMDGPGSRLEDGRGPQGGGGTDMAMDLMAMESEAEAEAAPHGTAWQNQPAAQAQQLSHADLHGLAGLRVSDAPPAAAASFRAPWGEPVPEATGLGGSGPPGRMGVIPQGHVAAARGLGASGTSAAAGQEGGAASQGQPSVPPPSDLDLPGQCNMDTRTAAGEAGAGGIGPMGLASASTDGALGPGPGALGAVDVQGLRARLARQAAAGLAAAGSSEPLGPAGAAVGAVDVLGLKARLARQASQQGTGLAAAGGTEPLGPAGAAVGAVDVLGLKARLARQASGLAASGGAEAPGPSSGGASASAGGGGGVDVNQIKERLARLAGRAEQAAAPSAHSLPTRPDPPAPPAPAPPQPTVSNAAGGVLGAVAPARPAPSPLAPLNLEADDGLGSIWGMDIDGPSEDDIGAVLQALGCSPCMQAGLGAGVFGLPPGQAPVWGRDGDGAAQGTQPQRLSGGVAAAGGGGGGGGLVGLKAEPMAGLADACQGQDQGGQVGAPDPHFDASARRLTFSAAVPHVR